MKNFINQIRTGDCGFTCLKIILSIINNDENYLYLDDPSLDNCTFFDLVNKASEYQIKLEGVKCNNIQLIKTPFIAHVHINKTSHFVVVKKITRRKIFILDPGFKQLIYSHREFLSIFKGNALIIQEYQKKDLKTIELPSLKHNLGLRAVGMLSLLVGLSFVNQNAQFVLSLGFFALCAIVAIVAHRNLLSIMKEFDQRFPLNEVNFKMVSELKMKYFSRRLKIFNALMICFITSALLVYNEYSFVVIIGIIIALLAVDKAVRNKYLNYRYKKMQLLGHKVLPHDLLNSSYKLANITTFFRIIGYFIAICFLLVQMEALKVVSLNYFIFYYGALIFIFENVNIIAAELTTKSEERTLRCLIENINTKTSRNVESPR